MRLALRTLGFVSLLLPHAGVHAAPPPGPPEDAVQVVSDPQAHEQPVAHAESELHASALPASAADPLPSHSAPELPPVSHTSPDEAFVVSSLPIPTPPSEPAQRKTFAMPASDPAGAAARSIARRVPTFRKYRTEVPGAVWSVDEQARFAIRDTQSCLAELEKRGVRARPVERELTTPVPVPVVIDEPVSGVQFVSLHEGRPIEVSCELAARLPELARILRAHGVRSVGVNSSYRDHPKVSFHTFGLALDIAALRTDKGSLIVARDFELSPNSYTCEAQPASEPAKALLAIVCAIAESHVFSSVLTPNYNAGHRDHLHLDLRPDDPRLFVR